jgi:hypothetical protein
MVVATNNMAQIVHLPRNAGGSANTSSSVPTIESPKQNRKFDLPIPP